MSWTRRFFLLACGLYASAALHAQTWPTRPVKIVVPFAAGGPADNYARFLAQRLQETLGQPFVVDDKPGAGSVIGTDIVAKSPADGYTLLLMSNTHTVNETLLANKPFVLTRDFTAVALVCSLGPQMLSVNATLTPSGWFRRTVCSSGKCQPSWR